MKNKYQKLITFACAGFICLSINGCGKNVTQSQSSIDNISTVSSQQESPEVQIDMSNSAILGNSYVYGFDIFSPIEGMDCFYVIGLNVRTAFTKPMIGREIPVIEELKSEKEYERVFLIFGENELGWPNEQAFLDGYGEIIDTVKEYQPQAKIYLISMLPVSQEVSNKNENGVNNTQIVSRNDKLKQLAEQKDIVYADYASEIMDENGALPEDAANDGIHPSSPYYNDWAEFLTQTVNENEGDLAK